MVILCDVQFDGQRGVGGVFAPGEVISGRVVLTLEERMLLRALYLKFAGYAAVRWEKSSKKPKNGSTKAVPTYTNREDYVSTLNFFIGSEEAMPKIVERGIYSYNFAVRLPNNCPANYESDTGHIRYELQVFMNMPDRQHSCYARTLAVQKPADLRAHTELMRAQDLEFQERKSFLQFWLQPLLVQVNMPQAGFIPGENISVYVKVHNSPQLTVRDIIYKLNMVSTYIGLYKKKSKVLVLRTSVVERVHSLLGPREAVIQHLDTLQVPQTPPSTQQGECRCMRISYEVEVLVTTMKKKRFVQATLPVTIGTISLRSNLRLMPVEVTGSAPALSSTPLSDPYGDLGTPNHMAITYGSNTNMQKSANYEYSRSMEQLNEKRRYVYSDVENDRYDNSSTSSSSTANTRSPNSKLQEASGYNASYNTSYNPAYNPTMSASNWTSATTSASTSASAITAAQRSKEQEAVATAPNYNQNR